VRSLFDAEEAAAYTADLDAQAEEQGVLDMARVATRLRGKLREELWAEGSGTGNTDEFLVGGELEVGDVVGVKVLVEVGVVALAESAAEQRALMASFETQHRDEAARCLLAAERRAAVDELAASHQNTRLSPYLRKLVAVHEARAASVGRRPQEDHTRVEAERRLQAEHARASELPRVRGHQYSCPPTTPMPASQKIAQRRRQQLREPCLHRRLETGNHGGSISSGAGGSDA
jgi:hypothetical protein